MYRSGSKNEKFLMSDFRVRKNVIPLPIFHVLDQKNDKHPTTFFFFRPSPDEWPQASLCYSGVWFFSTIFHLAERSEIRLEPSTRFRRLRKHSSKMGRCYSLFQLRRMKMEVRFSKVKESSSKMKLIFHLRDPKNEEPL